ncbi:MAG: sigma 54-interacting transcriptional regulator, partial [Thermoplasmata archaeon]|nr:sigma 54-interacting transcriptional regulator [Thermoplasmata archaeon]
MLDLAVSRSAEIGRAVKIAALHPAADVEAAPKDPRIPRDGSLAAPPLPKLDMACPARPRVSMAAAGGTRSAPPTGTKSTALQLKERGALVESPSERLRAEILRRIDASRKQGLSREEAAAALFPRTVLPTETYEDLTTALVAGSHVLFFGPSGAGKTNLAKEVWELFPKDAWVVSGCPVLDHPFSVIDSNAFDRFPPCPICRRRFAPGNDVSAFRPDTVDPAKVPAELVRLREGFGFARLQGSSEVFPDHLTGNINLRRLEEIGDPMSPLVLEPGKLLQANRGLLLVDEIGKLPLGTQNVLLQALQEGTVTPSKSRESFPGAFVAVGTSNLSDLDNINDPLSDRLTSLHVTYNAGHAANRRIVRLASLPDTGTFVPEILVDAGVRVIETWRQKASDDNPDIGEVGSNRTLIDVAARTAATATLHDHTVATVDDVKGGLLHAMRGRIRARSGDSFQQNERRVLEFVDEHLEPALKRSGGVYWCRFYRSVLKENKAEGEAVVSEGRRLKNDPALL